MIRSTVAGVLLVAALARGGAVPEPTIPGIGKASSECFVVLSGIAATAANRVECVDGDVGCDVDGSADGRCSFGVRVCVAQVLDGCQASAITSVKARPAKLGIAVPTVPASAPTCGAATTIVVPLAKDGRKKGRLKLVLDAKNDGKPGRERDQIKIACLPGDGTTPTTSTTVTPATLPSPTSTTRPVRR